MKKQNLKNIIQIFDNSYESSKEIESYEDRKDQFVWRDQITSFSREILHSELRIPGLRSDAEKIKSCDWIF